MTDFSPEICLWSYKVSNFSYPKQINSMLQGSHDKQQSTMQFCSWKELKAAAALSVFPALSVFHCFHPGIGFLLSQSIWNWGTTSLVLSTDPKFRLLVLLHSASHWWKLKGTCAECCQSGAPYGTEVWASCWNCLASICDWLVSILQCYFLSWASHGASLEMLAASHSSFNRSPTNYNSDFMVMMRKI